MTEDLKLPPRRPLPPQVRDRLRARVLGGVRSPLRTRLDRARPPLAVAASVAVLAAGAAIVAQSVQGSPDGAGTPTAAPTATSGATLNHQEADGELDRCWNALRQAGKADQYPARSAWRPVFNYNFGPVRVTAARAAGKPLFCETSYTRATVSDPNAEPAYAATSGTGAVLTTDLGTIAGVVDPNWRGIWVEGVDGETNWRAPATAKDGLFLVHGPGITSGGAGVDVGEAPPPEEGRDGEPGPWLPLPRSAQPAASVLDRPAEPAPDRESADGQLLDQCLAAAARTSAVVDTESWAPGAVLRHGDDYLVMARNREGFSTCWRVGDRTDFGGYRAFRQRADDPKPSPVQATDVNGQKFLVGTVHQTCVRMEVTFAKSGVVEADVANSTFAVLVPATDTGPGEPTPTAKLFDGNGRLIYQGPLP